MSREHPTNVDKRKNVSTSSKQDSVTLRQQRSDVMENDL